ncbi:MAG TPA: hypothetical protein PLV25_06005, partial [Opitutales bacterium]|nr:hypothetical protein [Opitutales bacterium]
QALVLNAQGLEAFKYAQQRAKLYEGKRRLIYYWVLAEDGSEADGQVSWRVQQTVRLDRPGEDSYLGNDSVEDIHYVTLKQTGNGAWKVASFEDAGMRGY